MAASRGEDYTAPNSEARDAMLGADEKVEATSKVGAVVQSFGQIFAGLKKSKSEVSEVADAVDAAVELKAVEPFDEVDEVEAPKSFKVGGVLAKMSALPKTLKKKKSEPIEVVVAPENVMPADVVVEDYDLDAMDEIAEFEPAFIPAKPSMMAQFDTPLMGVLAAIFVSSVGLIGASALFG